MTAADWFDYGPQAMGNFASFFAIFLTLTSAYLIAAFVAGRVLSRSQVVLINTLFLLCSFFNILSQGATLRNGMFAFQQGTALVESMESVPEIFTKLLPGTVMVVSFIMVLGCLKFMWDIRHPKID